MHPFIDPAKETEDLTEELALDEPVSEDAPGVLSILNFRIQACNICHHAASHYNFFIVDTDKEEDKDTLKQDGKACQDFYQT